MELLLRIGAMRRSTELELEAALQPGIVVLMPPTFSVWFSN